MFESKIKFDNNLEEIKDLIFIKFKILSFRFEIN